VASAVIHASCSTLHLGVAKKLHVLAVYLLEELTRPAHGRAPKLARLPPQLPASPQRFCCAR
jgi:hypothetical protein